VTHASIQTRALTEIPRYLREYGKPVVIDECCYEGDLPHIWGSISGQEMVRRFWRCYVGGGACTAKPFCRRTTCCGGHAAAS
jgi:hypothetical protein